MNENIAKIMTEATDALTATIGPLTQMKKVLEVLRLESNKHHFRDEGERARAAFAKELLELFKSDQN